MEENQKIVIELPNGLKLVAERNTDKAFANEIFIGIMDGEVWHQDLAIVRNSYGISEDGKTQWKDGEYEVIVFGDKDDEDYTHKFEIGLYKEQQ